MHYFYPQTQAPAGVSLSDHGTPAQSGYLTTDGTALNYVNAAGASQDLAGGLTQVQTHRLQIGAPAKNPSAVGTLASGLLAPGAATLDSVRLAVGTLPTGATDAFSFNVHTPAGDLFASAQVWAREVDVTGFAKSVDIAATFTNYLTEVTGTGTANVAIDTLANGDQFYAGFSDIFAGVRFDMDGANVNDVVATLAAHYWNGSAWTALTITDGTSATSKTLKQDGAVTWEPPADWTTNAIGSLGTKYWVRFTVSAAMTAGTAIDNADIIRAVNHGYAFTPDQNATVALGAELRLHCTEADSNAAGLFVQVAGTYT